MYEIDCDRIPEAYRPLSAWTYFGLEILYALPIAGWIFLICHAIGSRNTPCLHHLGDGLQGGCHSLSCLN